MVKIIKTVLMFIPLIGLIIILFDLNIYKSKVGEHKSILENETVLNLALLLQCVFINILIFKYEELSK